MLKKTQDVNYKANNLVSKDQTSQVGNNQINIKEELSQITKQNINNDDQNINQQESLKDYTLQKIDINISEQQPDQQQVQQPKIKLAPYQKLLKEIEQEAEKILPDKKIISFFQDIYQPLEITEDDMQELKAILRAIADISANDGQTLLLEERLNKNITLNKPTDYDMQQLRKAKEIFDDCQRHDMEKFGVSRVNQQNLTSNFQKINRDIVIGKDATINPTIDQIPAKIMGQHKALIEGDFEKYEDLRQNKMTRDEIMNYLEEYRESDLTYFDKQLSEDINQDINYLSNEYFSKDKDFDIDFDDINSIENGLLITFQDQSQKINQINLQQPSMITKQNNERIKLKMFDELENIDHIIKQAEDNLTMTKHEYLHHLRKVYHEKVTGLKQQRDLFRAQLNKMQRVHVLQMRNIENFALSIAAEMFRKKAIQVKKLFKDEADLLNKEYVKLHSLMTFYDKKFHSLKSFLATQESLLQDQYLYLSEHQRKKKRYIKLKEQAERQIQELNNERYSKIAVKEFMKQEFDFYGLSIRIGQIDQSKLVKDIVFKRFERENEQAKIQLKFAKNEIDMMKNLMEVAQDEESKAKIELYRVQQELEQEKFLHAKDIALKEKELQNTIEKMKQHLQKVLSEYKSYRNIVSQESLVNQHITDKISELNNQLKLVEQERTMLQNILKYPHICKEFHSRVKNQAAFDITTQMNLVNQIFHECFDGAGGLPLISEQQYTSPQGQRSRQQTQIIQNKQGRSSPVLQDVSIFKKQKLTIQEKNYDVMSEDVKQYLGDAIGLQKYAPLKQLNQISEASQTTRLLSSQHKDTKQDSLIKTSINWNNSNSVTLNQFDSQIDNFNRPLLTQSSIETPINISYPKNKLINRAHQMLSLPTTRGNMRSGIEQGLMSGSLQDKIDDILSGFNTIRGGQIPNLSLYSQSIENKKRLIKRNFMNQSLQNPHLKWNEISHDDNLLEKSIDQTQLPINGTKMQLEMKLNKLYKQRNPNQNSLSPDTTTIHETKNYRYNLRQLQSRKTRYFKSNNRDYQKQNDHHLQQDSYEKQKSYDKQVQNFQNNGQNNKHNISSQVKNNNCSNTIESIKDKYMQIRNSLRNQQNSTTIYDTNASLPRRSTFRNQSIEFAIGDKSMRDTISSQDNSISFRHKEKPQQNDALVKTDGKVSNLDYQNKQDKRNIIFNKNEIMNIINWNDDGMNKQ